MPVDYQAFAAPPQQRVDYNAQLMENFNVMHQDRCNRRSNHHSSTVQSRSAQAGPDDMEHRRQLGLQQQTLFRQIDYQRKLELQQEMQRQQEREQQRLLEQQQQAIHEQEEICQS